MCDSNLIVDPQICLIRACVIVCVCVCMLTGVNLLVGTENGLKLLDRSGQGKVYPLINSRRFQQMDVLEGLNLLITISGFYTLTSSGKNILTASCSPLTQSFSVRQKE